MVRKPPDVVVPCRDSEGAFSNDFYYQRVPYTRNETLGIRVMLSSLRWKKPEQKRSEDKKRRKQKRQGRGGERKTKKNGEKNKIRVVISMQKQ